MIFNSVSYLLFLLIVVVLYWVIGNNRLRISMLFVASLIFYGFWRIDFIPLIVFSAFIDYYAAIKIYESPERKTKLFYLIGSMLINLGLLFYFKYTLFFLDSVEYSLHLFGYQIQMPRPEIILPLGISFSTFQSLSYTIDTYRGLIVPERNFLTYNAFVDFFPQLIAGPVLRGNEVLEPINHRPPIDWEKIGVGLRRILFGLFLKVGLADNIAPFVDDGFSVDPNLLGPIDVITLAFLFGFQIYFDFSAYSHLALGTAKLMGIDFPENFNFPYLSVSPKEFWKRWHISLSSWIRDYLYLPLVGKTGGRKSVGGLGDVVDDQKRSLNILPLFITWSIMGLWHGANWTFVCWGIYHALLITIYRLILPVTSKLPFVINRFGGWAVTTLFAMLSWILFRAENVGHAFHMYSRLFKLDKLTYLGLRENNYLVAFLVFIGMIITYWIGEYLVPKIARFKWTFAVLEVVVFSLIILIDFVYLRPIKQFIYFQF